MDTFPSPTDLAESALVKKASYISLGVSVVLLACKFLAFKLTGSQAVFSDAMESIVNVVAAALTLLVISVARKPADKEHPYGHGKVEFFSAAFEGGLIAFASILILVEAGQSLIRGRTVEQISIGIGIVIATGVCNAVLGFYLLRVGKKHQSSALEASGRHVITDFWTSVSVVLGLFLVSLTNKSWIDPIVAIVMGLVLARTGYILVRRSVGGLLDEEDRNILENLVGILEHHQTSGIIQVHHVRVMRSGRYHHIDAHAVIPEFWDVAEAHNRTEAFERELMQEYSYPGELHLHVDPCRQAYCRVCDVAACPIRLQPFEKRRLPSIDELTNPEEPNQFKAESERT